MEIKKEEIGSIISIKQSLIMTAASFLSSSAFDFIDIDLSSACLSSAVCSYQGCLTPIHQSATLSAAIS